MIILQTSHRHTSTYLVPTTSEEAPGSHIFPVLSNLQPYGQSTPSTIWAPSTQDTHVKPSKDRDKGRDKYRDERGRERNIAELDRDRHRELERYRSEVHREKDKTVENEKDGIGF